MHWNDDFGRWLVELAAAAQPKLLLLVVAEANANCPRAHAQRSQRPRGRVGRVFAQVVAARKRPKSAAKVESPRLVDVVFRN
jgi:hypothetical protein